MKIKKIKTKHDKYTKTLLDEMYYCFKKNKYNSGSMLFRPLLINYVVNLGEDINNITNIDYGQAINYISSKQIFHNKEIKLFKKLKNEVNEINHNFKLANEDIAKNIWDATVILYSKKSKVKNRKLNKVKNI